MEKYSKKIPAKTCYDHMGGKPVKVLMQSFIGNGWIEKQSKSDKHFVITAVGEKQFKKMGIDITLIKEESNK